MFGALIRLVLVAVIVVGALALFAGYRLGDRNVHPSGDTPVGTTGSRPAIDPERARERGAEAGEKVADAINRAGEAVGDAGLTAKIKSKMALDDTVKASRIDVDTRDGVVTLRGQVESEATHARALSLARETRGVTRVVDELTVAR
jgi:hypothetical protein